MLYADQDFHIRFFDELPGAPGRHQKTGSVIGLYVVRAFEALLNDLRIEYEFKFINNKTIYCLQRINCQAMLHAGVCRHKAHVKPHKPFTFNLMELYVCRGIASSERYFLVYML